MHRSSIGSRRFAARVLAVLFLLGAFSHASPSWGEPVPTPRNLHRTQSAAECSLHGGGSYCKHVADDPSVLIVWTGDRIAYQYRVYRTDAIPRILVGTVVSNDGATTPTIFRFRDVPLGACYVVSEVRTPAEGTASSPWCMPRYLVDANRTAVEKSLEDATSAGPPSNVHATTDVAECRQHGGDLPCKALEDGTPNVTVLVWNGSAPAQSYAVYRTDNELHELVAQNVTPINGFIPTVVRLKTVPEACYAVTEMADGKTTAASAPYCLTSPSQL